MFNNDFKESVQAIEPDSIINSTIGHIVNMEKSPKWEKPKIEDKSINEVMKDMSDVEKEDQKFMDLVDKLNEDTDTSLSQVSLFEENQVLNIQQVKKNDTV